MNEAWIWWYIFLLKGGGGPHDVDIILGGVVTKWWCLITVEGGGLESGEKWLHNKLTLPNYVICKLLSN